MKSNRQNRRTVQYVVCTAIAAALVSGCASSGGLAMGSSSKAANAQSESAGSEAVAKAERLVAKSPQDAALRAELGQAYLMAGRFESAITTFSDARHLGDESVRTALSLALAYGGAGQNDRAVSILDQWRDSIPASDLGLALALAGETGRGVTVLSEALRAGEDTPKLRQNLAYAYALDGRWREARLMAAQDVPGNELDARISEWATMGRPGDYRKRVAGTLGAPVRADAGQPASLALARPDTAPVEAVALSRTYTTEENGELPPVEDGESFWIAEAARPQTPVQARAQAEPLAVSAPPAPVTAPASATGFDDAFAAPDQASARYVSKPLVQQLPVRTASASHSAKASVARSSSVRGEGTYLVQLGSFSSAKNAERAWSIFVARNPELKNFDKTITQAMVRGKKYWRVSGAGFDSQTARSMCSSVKGRGYGCIAYAAGRPLPGGIADGSRLAVR